MVTKKADGEAETAAMGVVPASPSQAQKLEDYQKKARDGGFGVVGGHFTPDLDRGPGKEAVEAPQVKRTVGVGEDAREATIRGGSVVTEPEKQ